MPAPPRQMITPAVDAVCVGGASLAVVGLLLPLSPAAAAPLLQKLVWPAVALNWPHFMASYHLLYTTPGAARRYPFAAVYVPALLLAYAVMAALLFEREPLFFHAFHATAAIYLAWHYTGQAWGMIAAFAHVAGAPLDETARRLLQANLRVLLAWHAVWAVHGLAAKAGFTPFAAFYQAVSVAAAASALLGAAGLWRLPRVPWRVLLPWLAIHGWYLLLYRHPKALFLVQLAHALQYLVFPLRVEANRRAAREGRASLAGSALYYAALVGSGLLFFEAAPRLAAQAGLWASLTAPAAVLVLDLLNIHHYFLDGCIWKLRNPEVRRDLFSHLEPAR